MGRFPRKVTNALAGRKQAKRDKTRRRMKKADYKAYMSYVANIHATVDQAIIDGAKKFNRPLAEVRSRVHSRTRLASIKERIHHAYLHIKAKELNEGKAVGHRLKLPEIQRIVREEVPHYSTRPMEEKRSWLRALSLHKAEGDTQKRRNRKAEVADHAATIEALARDMQGAEMRYGLKSFFMGVRSDSSQQIAPTILCGEDVKECIALYMGKTPEQMVRMLEVCILNGREGIVGSAKRMNANQLRSECRQFIQTLLNMAISSGGDSYDTVDMNYESYETAIVARYGYRLTGWTWGNKVCNPGKITRVDDLRALHSALVNKTCRWEAVQQEERDAITAAAAAAAAAEPEKRRADYGTKRGSYKEAAALRAAEAAAAEKENTVAAAPKAKAKKSSKGKKASGQLSATTNAQQPAASTPVPAAAAVPAASTTTNPVPAASTTARAVSSTNARAVPTAPQSSSNSFVAPPLPSTPVYPVSSPAMFQPPPSRLSTPVPSAMNYPPATQSFQQQRQFPSFPPPTHVNSNEFPFSTSSYPSPSFQSPFPSSSFQPSSFQASSFSPSDPFMSNPSFSSAFPDNYMSSSSSFPSGSTTPIYNHSSSSLPTPRPASSNFNPVRPAF